MAPQPQVQASRKQRLLNCAAWNAKQAELAAKQGDEARALRLKKQAETLYESAKQI